MRSGNFVSYKKVVDDDILQVDVKKIDRANALLSLGCILQFLRHSIQGTLMNYEVFSR